MHNVMHCLDTCICRECIMRVFLVPGSSIFCLDYIIQKWVFCKQEPIRLIFKYNDNH